MTFKHPKRLGFSRSSLHKRKNVAAMDYFSQRVTFWIAVISVFAFVTGNMMGQYGWHVFWKSVLGGYDDSLLTYTGTVPPIRQIPDPFKWYQLYGGNFRDHTFREAPADILIPLPSYQPFDQRPASDLLAARVYAVDNLGTYKTGGGQGSHAGIDIDVPIGTPVQSVMDGIVYRVAADPVGFGNFLMIKHRAPDPSHPSQMIIMYSLYAHLSTVLVTEGTLVHKGDTVAASGMSGDATGPHLHFQMERGDAPTHPFWPFTGSEARAANLTFSQAIDKGLDRDRGLLYLINPMLYVQTNYAANTQIAQAASSSSSKPLTMQQLAQQRAQQRLARLATTSSSAPFVAVVSTTLVAESDHTAAPVSSVSSSSASSSSPALSVPVQVSGDFVKIDIQTTRSFTNREPIMMRLVLLDENGNVVTAPSFKRDIYLRTAYGSARFDPQVLTPLDFRNGKADVRLIPQGNQTIVPLLQPYGIQGAPITYTGQR